MSTDIYNRKHRIYVLREAQLRLNQLAANGGRPYIENRLWRAPNESDLSWTGKRVHGPQESGSVGRRDRTAIVNDAGRVMSKITQYLFKNPVTRPDLDEEWAQNVMGQGVTILEFWRRVNESLTHGQWVWLQADRNARLVDAETGEPRDRTLLEKERDGDVVRWRYWPSVSVPDWSIDANGNILWLITTDLRYDNTDPMREADEYVVRTLWQRVEGGVEVVQYRVGADDQKREISRTMIAGLEKLPFVLIGHATDEPWWFDDVELLQAQLLNMDSLHFENLIKAVFPQLIISAGSLDSLQMKLSEQYGETSGERVVQLIREVVRGLDSPLVEGAEEKGITRFIQPSAADLKALPDEISRKRQVLFDTTGLALFNKETRLIQTAESKEYDQLDTESTLKNRALLMQEAEKALIEVSLLIDPLFVEYEPEWPTSFDVVDTERDATTIQLIANMPDATPAIRKLALIAALRVLQEIAGQNQEMIDQARKEIEEADFSEPPMLRDPFEFDI